MRESQKIAAAKSGSSSEDRKKQAAIREAKAKFTLYNKQYDLTPGMIVKWKENLNNRRFPSKDGVAIVTRVLTQVVYDNQKKDAGTPLFMEPLTVCLGVIDNDNDFAEFHYDGHRFMPAEPQDAAPRVVQRLRDTFGSLNDRPILKKGDLVQWKPGLKNKKRPKEDEAAIVVDFWEEPVFDKKKGSGAQYFREPLDCKLAVLDDDGDLVVYHFDSRRFRVVHVD